MAHSTHAHSLLHHQLHPPWTLDDDDDEDDDLNNGGEQGRPLGETTWADSDATLAPAPLSTESGATSAAKLNYKPAHVSPAGSSTLDSPDFAVFGLAPLSNDPLPSSGDATTENNNCNDDDDDSDPLPEMMYVTDELGNILTLKDPGTWNKWLTKNCPTVPKDRLGRSLCPWLVGRNLFEYIDDEKVASFTRHIIYMLGTSQQENFKYFWFCDTPSHERKMLMNVTAHQAFDDSKLIVWASRIIYEKPLAVAQNWLNSEVIVCNTTANPSSSAQLETASSISNSSSATLQPQSVVPSYSEPSRVTASSTTCPVTSKPITKCLPNRNVCSYCKRIMVLSDDLDPKIVQMITSSSQTLPASIIYEGPIPFIGARGRSGVQPASPSGSDYSSSSSSQTATHTASSTTPVQLSIQGVTNHLWLSPHQYYNIANLDDNVTIYNGVCEVCYAEIGYLFFKRGTFANGMRVVAEESLGAEIKRLEVVEKQVEKEKLGAAFKSLKRGSGSAGGMEREEKKVRLIAPKPGSAVPVAVSDGPRSVF